MQREREEKKETFSNCNVFQISFSSCSFLWTEAGTLFRYRSLVYLALNCPFYCLDAIRSALSFRLHAELSLSWRTCLQYIDCLLRNPCNVHLRREYVYSYNSE